jgi:hypothetical protein
MEGQQGLRGKEDFLVTRESAARCARAASGQSPDQSAFSAPGQSADQRAQARAAAVRLPLPFSAREMVLVATG